MRLDDDLLARLFRRSPRRIELERENTGFAVLCRAEDWSTGGVGAEEGAEVLDELVGGVDAEG